VVKRTKEEKMVVEEDKKEKSRAKVVDKIERIN